MQRGLRVAGDVGDDASKDGGLVGRGARVGVEVLQLDLFATKVVCEAVELAGLVLFAILVGEDVILDAFPHSRRVLIQDAAHCRRTDFARRGPRGSVGGRAGSRGRGAAGRRIEGNACRRHSERLASGMDGAGA